MASDRAGRQCGLVVARNTSNRAKEDQQGARWLGRLIVIAQQRRHHRQGPVPGLLLGVVGPATTQVLTLSRGPCPSPTTPTLTADDGTPLPARHNTHKVLTSQWSLPICFFFQNRVYRTGHCPLSAGFGGRWLSHTCSVKDLLCLPPRELETTKPARNGC